MAEGNRKPSGSAAGANPPPPTAPAAGPPPPRRRFIQPPANDNALSPLHRGLRAAAFVAIGAVLAWVLHYVLG